MPVKSASKAGRGPAKTIESEFRKRIGRESSGKSAVGGSLDRVAGESKKLSKGGGSTRQKLRAKAALLTPPD